MKNINDVISGVDGVFSNAKHGNFEEVLTKTKNYAEKATKKSAERLEISRKKIELLDSKTKLSKAYEKFGKLYHDKSIGEEVSEDELKSCMAEIELQKTRTEMLDKEIEELRDLFTDTVSKHDFHQVEKQVRDVEKKVRQFEKEARREAKRAAKNAFFEDADAETEATEETAEPEVEVEVVTPEE